MQGVKYKHWILAAVIAAVLAVTSLCCATRQTAAAASSVDSNYRFNTINVAIDVQSDKTLHITETLTTEFFTSGVNTGIIRDIQRLSVTTRVVDGKQKKGSRYVAKVSDVSVTLDGGPAVVTESLYNNGNFHSVKMQSPRGKLDSGVHVFILSYTYDMHDDSVRAFDDLTFDVLGYAMAYTDTFSARITFPAPIDTNRVTFRTNRKQSWTPSGDEWTRVSDNTVEIFARPQAEHTGYTVQVLLPKGYFAASRTFYWYYILFAMLILAVIGLIAFLTVRELPRKPVEITEYYPPEDVGVMQYSAIWHRGARRKDAAALILKWSSEELLHIEKEGKRDLILKRRPGKKAPAEEIGLGAKPAGKNFTKAEKQYYDVLFSRMGGGSGVFSTKYFRKKEKRHNKEVLFNATEGLRKEGNKPDPIRPSRNIVRRILPSLSVIPSILLVAYNAIILQTFIPLLFCIFMAAGTFVSAIATDPESRHPIMYIFPVMFYAMPFSAYCAIFALPTYDYARLLYLCVVVYALGNFVLPYLLGRRTERANDLYGRMLGFKRFLLTAELPRIQMLFDENPDYFEDITPWCLIMGISDKIQKRFAALDFPLPSYVRDGVDPRWVGARIAHSCSHAAHSVSRFSGGGGGGGGGGGSSGGGGGGGGSRGC